MEKIAIQSCSENWDKMTSIEQGKHCAKCDKVVHQVAHLSTDQIREEWLKNNGSLCIRIPKKRTIEVPKPFFTRWKYAIIAASIAFWFNVKNSTLLAQVTKSKPIEESHDQKISTIRITGHVIDSLENMEPIPFAYIKIQLPDSSVQGTYSNAEGIFHLSIEKELNTSDSITISCSMLGYETSTQTTQVKDSIDMEVFLAQNHVCMKEQVITVDEIRIIQGIMINDWTQGVPLDRGELIHKKILYDYDTKNDYDTKTYHHDEIERYNLGR